MTESFNDDDLDRVVDDVARELTMGEPDGAFGARVLARVASGGATRRRWRATWILTPLAAAAAIVIVIVVGSRSPERLALQRTQTPSTTAAGREPSTTSREPRTEKTEPRTRTRTPNPESRLPNPGSRILSAVAALAPDPLSVDTIAIAPIAADDPLTVPQLDAPRPIDIAPLEIEKEIRQ